MCRNALAAAMQTHYEESHTCSEKGLRYVSSSCRCKVRLDGALITDQTIKKCDFLMIKCNESNRVEEYYFVELGSKNINEAYDQVCSAISHLRQRNLLEDNISIHGRIVVKQFPAQTTAYTQQVLNFKRRYSGTYKKVNNNQKD